MTSDEWLGLLAGELGKISGNELKLLLLLRAEAAAQGKHEVAAVDSTIRNHLGMAKDTYTTAKRGLGKWLQVDSTRGAVTVFKMPANWFDPQRTLFAIASSPIIGQPMYRRLVARIPESGQVKAQELGNSSPETGHGPPRNQATQAQFLGMSSPETRQPSPETGQVGTENKGDSGALSISSSRSEISCSSRDYVFSILSTRHLLETLRPSALALAGELQNFMHQRGDQQVAKNPPDDRILAQCLAIASLRELLPVLPKAKERNAKPGNYAWFVTTFLCDLKGIPREHTNQIRKEWRELRQAKPPARAEALPSPAEMVAQAANSVKTLR